MAYPRVLLILLESRLLRGREGNSLLVHAPITLLLLHFLSFLFFYILNFLSYSYIPSFLPYFPLFSFLLFFSLVFPCSLLASHCSSSSSCCYSLCIAKTFLYCLPWWVLPLNYFWFGVSVLPRPLTGVLAAQLLPLPCIGCATFHS